MQKQSASWLVDVLRPLTSPARSMLTNRRRRSVSLHLSVVPSNRGQPPLRAMARNRSIASAWQQASVVSRKYVPAIADGFRCETKRDDESWPRHGNAAQRRSAPKDAGMMDAYFRDATPDHGRGWNRGYRARTGHGRSRDGLPSPDAAARQLSCHLWTPPRMQARLEHAGTGLQSSIRPVR